MHSSAMSKFIVGLIDQFVEESCQLQAHADQAHEFQTKTLAEFQKAYEEQSRTEAEQLVADVTNLVSNHISRQKKMVDVQLVGLRDAATGNKAFLVNHSSRMEGVTSEAKRKWHTFSMQAENDAKNGADFSASKHCRMEAFLQKCIATVDNASKHWKRTCESVNGISSKHVKDMESHVRGAIESNDRHDDEIGSARDTAEQDVAESSGDILCHFDRLSEQERESVSGIIQAIEAHTGTLEKLQEDHLACAAEMGQRAKDTFEDRYMDHEPSGATPTRCDLDVPSKVVIESLRAMPMDTLLEEFRENHPYGSAEKEPKPSLIPRSPLIQLN